MSPPRMVGIVGAGAFGMALAAVAARAGHAAVLWGRDAEQMAKLAASRTSDRLPGLRLPKAVTATSALADLAAADLLLVAVPAQATRQAAAAAAPHIRSGAPAVACAKGIEQATGAFQTAILAECLPGHAVAALSGPGFAEEIARGLPTAVTVAAEDRSLAERLCADLSAPGFRPYASTDVTGVELGGALKNVLAIACGVVAGRGLGESARAALISRGMAEMIRLGAALGAKAETFMGLSGLGDLVLTATSEKSRNMRFGMALGRGRSAASLMAAGAPLAEGAHTARVAVELARRHGVEVPLSEAVAAVIAGRLTIDEAIDGLVNRPLRAETE
jgi:glycerol-3-phosphate dehydrogenase (NAD(P)+)